MIAATSIANSGIRASLARLNVSVSNIANIASTGTVMDENRMMPSGLASSPVNSAPLVYQPFRAVQAAMVSGGVSTYYEAIEPSYQAMQPNSIKSYYPSASYADPSGMIARPNVDLIQERVDQLSAIQAYEANVSVIKTANDMDKSLIDLEA